MSFVGLHIHSDYSLLDGASQLPQLIDRAVELGMPAIALTDHGVMYGAIQLIKLCRSKGIKPIIGNEMYVINGEIEKQQKGKKFHQVVLAKNTQGYKNLVKLTTLSHLNGFQGKGIFARPCINKELLEKYHKGLIVTSGCLAGEVPQNLLQGKPEEAIKIAKWYKDLFGEDYYLEIQDHGFQEDRVVNTGIAKIAKKLKIKIVATNDSHFISCRDVEAHDALLCINTQKLIVEEKRMRYSGTEYLKSAEEMKQLFRDHLEKEVIEEAIANTLEVADKVKEYKGILGEPRIPDYPIPPEHNADTYLEELAWDGLLKRLKLKQKNELPVAYKERMETELKVLQEKGFSTYFLVVWDYIKYARDQNIPVGPGRGSAAGSLVAYSLRITNIDPVHHGLLFERFLNPERKSMPDIDTDFCIESRDEMIEYVTERYGEERVAQIITFNRMTSKAVLKDVGRVLGVPFGEANKMAKLIPVARGKPAKLKVMISGETPSAEFKESYENKEIQIEDNEGGKFTTVSVRQWLDMAIRIEGTNKTFGVHAAGVVISKERLDEIVPLQRNNDGAVITQYHMEDIESLGLLKMDFLGLKNLTIIQNTADLIEQNHHLPLVPDELPANERRAMEILARGNIKKMPEDVKKTYELIKSGDLEGVFQLESSGMVDVVKKLKPSCIEDISSILALYRPGPLDAGLIPKFIDRKHGREKIEYQHPKLEPILQETYGVLCLPKGTLIDKPDGSRVAIENVKSGEVILTSDGKKVWQAKVAKQWRSGVREILKITLSSGTVIYSGKNHRFLTPEGDKFAWELQPGVGGVKNGLMYGSTVYEKWQVSSNKKKLGKNEAYLLGLLIGKSHFVSSTPHISCSTQKGTVWVANLIDEIGGGEAKYYFDAIRRQIYLKLNTQSKSTALTEFLDGIYGSRSWQVKSVAKHLPEDILDYSEKDRIDLLCGIWNSGGCDRERLLYFWSSSPRLLSQVGKLLGSLKIDYYLADNYVRVSDRSRFIYLLGNSQMPKQQKEEVSENYLPISSLALATGLEDSISQMDSSPWKTLELLQKDTLFRQTNFSDKTKQKNWEKVKEKHLQISPFTLATGLEDSICQMDNYPQKTQKSFRQKATLFRQTNFSDQTKLENWEETTKNNLQISPLILATGLEDSICQMDNYPQKNLESSRQKANLFRQTNFSNKTKDKTKQENWEKVKEKHLQISPFTLATGLEDSIPQTDGSPQKTLESSRQKANLFRQTNFSDQTKLENWEETTKNNLQISPLALATYLEDSICQTDSSPQKTLESSRQKANLFRQTNFSDQTKLENWEETTKNNLQISPLALATYLEDSICQTDSSPQKTLESSRQKATLFRQANFSDKTKQENWQKVRENNLQISPLALATYLEDSICQTDSSPQKTLESSRQKANLFRQTNFSDQTKLENWEETTKNNLQISPLALATYLEDSICQTDSSPQKTLESSRQKANLFRQTNFSDQTKLENWEETTKNNLQISPLALATYLEDSICQTDSSPQKTLESSRQKATLFRQANFSDKTKQENWQKVRENNLQISPLALATYLEDSICQTDSSPQKTLESSRQKATLFRQTNFSDQTKLENWEEFDREIYEKTYLQDTRLVYVVSVEEAGEAECFDLEMEDQNSPYFLTQGVVVHNCYQEQIMKMAQDLAGYSLGEADLLRRCLSGSTKVIDAATGNLVSLKEIAAKPEYWLNRKVFSLDIKNQKIVQKPITEIHPNGMRDVWEITTRTNRKIRATNDHLFYTVLGWKPLKDFSVGDRLGLPKEIPINHSSEISDRRINHLQTIFASDNFRENSNSQLSDKIPNSITIDIPKPNLSSHRINHLQTTFSSENLRENSHYQVCGKIPNSTTPDTENFIANIDLIPHSQKSSFIPMIEIDKLKISHGKIFSSWKYSYNPKPNLSSHRINHLQTTFASENLRENSNYQVCDKIPNSTTPDIPKPNLSSHQINHLEIAFASENLRENSHYQVCGKIPSSTTLDIPKPNLSSHRINHLQTTFASDNFREDSNSQVFWDEITSIEYIGKEEVFDLTIPETHNFIANDFIVHNCMGKKKVSEMEKHREIFIDGATKRGVHSGVAEDLFEQMIKFAEYCFNKSHSTAYAYVAYQTAYLKANYPVEYMAALITANSGDQDKVQKYIANCQKFNIEVEPPNINKSEVDFTPLPKELTKEKKDKILFGLSAVKNVGDGAIEAILKARKEEGEFKSLADLCDRVNLNALNSRTLESLIKCGAFDQIESNRKQLITDLEGLMKWAQDRNKDRDMGQLSLFDVAETTMPAFYSAPKHPHVDDFPAKEKLQYEKEIIGFYVSEHPLKYAHEQNQIKDVITIAQMKEKKSKSAIKLVVMLAGIKHHITKKGDPMAFLQIEDMTGQVDAVVFPKIYEEIKDLLTENALLVLSGKVDNKDDESQLLVDSAEALEKVMADAVEQQEKPVTELDNYQNESIDEEIKIHQPIAEVEKPVEQLDSQKNPPKKDAELLIVENGSAKQRQIIILQIPVNIIPEDNSLFEQIKAIVEEQSSGDKEKANVAIGALIFDDKQQKLVQFGRQFWVEDEETTIRRFHDARFKVKIYSWEAFASK